MRALAAVLLLALAGCATPVATVSPGDVAIGERLHVRLDGAWNLVGTEPAQVWSMEGAPVDRLLIYSGVKSGEPLAKDLAFRAGMRQDELISLFGKVLGEGFSVGAVHASTFGGKGLRFEYTLVKDRLSYRGIGYAAVNKGELFAILYVAPRLVFFDAYKERVERIARSAVIS